MPEPFLLRSDNGLVFPSRHYTAWVQSYALKWVLWFNHHRLLEPMGCIPPAKAEASYDRQLACQVTTVAA